VRAALVISERDNVATALQPLEDGVVLDLGAIVLTVREPIPPGHKISLRAIGAGEQVIKYGSPIGLATADIAAGTHVHTHNVSSSRGRGDLDEPASPAEPRLAEPPDAAGQRP
jgi:altronate dehydratase